MTRIWYGELEMHQAMNQGLMKVSAAPVYLRHIKRWLHISGYTTDDPSMAPS